VGFNVTLSDATAKLHPNLAKVLKNIDRSDSPAAWFEEEGLEAGEWIKFKARLNYILYSEEVEDYNADGTPRPSPVPPPPPCFFWQPKPNPETTNAVVLLLHGSPENIIGIGTADSSMYTAKIQRVGSVLAEVSRYLFQLRTGGPEELPTQLGEFELQIYQLCQRLYSKLPTATASWMAGYAKVSAFMTLPNFTNPLDDNRIRLVLATPLYVEQLPVSRKKGKKSKN
jgi:hypothetical protein